MKIPIFVSCPTALNDSQKISRTIIQRELNKLGLEPRQLGKSDYPTELPLREVYVIAKKCSGGLILGFEQFHAIAGSSKRGAIIEHPTSFPTEWNNLEAGILFSLDVPLLVFKEDGISGGVFDAGVSDVFVHKMPDASVNSKSLSAVFRKWDSMVRHHYYFR